MRCKILFIDFNSYFASVEQQLEPRLRGRPVAVVPVMSNSTCAIAASYEAKAFGVKTGTNIGDARRLCPGLICVMARHGAYVDYHERLTKEIDRYIPILKEESIDEMSCQLYGRYQEESAAVELAHRIKSGIAQNVGECLGSSIGISTNRFLAKVASDMKKPNGITLLDPVKMPGCMESLKLRDLPGIGPNMEKRLIEKKITTISQLYHCAPKQAASIWGSIEGERFWRALHGEEVERPEATGKMVTHSHVLAPQDRPLQRAAGVGRRLLLKAASRMRDMQMKATRMDLGMLIERGERLEGGCRFPPLQDSFALIKVFDGLWATVAHDEPPRLIKVSIALHGLIPLSSPEQLLLFPEEGDVMPRSEAQRRNHEQLSMLLDKVTGRYGRDSLTLGLTKNEGSGFTGVKIAFTRIPKPADFEGHCD